MTGPIKLVTLIAVAAFAFAGGYLIRGAGPGAASSPATSATSAGIPSPAAGSRTYADGDMAVGFVEAGTDTPWLAANVSSMKETATARGIGLRFYDSAHSIENQIIALTQFIGDPQVNVIVLDPVVGTGHAYDTVLEAAARANKPVIVEGDQTDADPSLYYTYVGSDFDWEGQNAAAAMCDLLKDKTSKNVVEIGGDPASRRAIDRATGFRTAMSACGITITQSESSPSWDPAEAESIMAGFLARSHDIQGVIAQDDEMAVGAIQAIKASGLVPGRDIMLVGFLEQAGPLSCRCACSAPSGDENSHQNGYNGFKSLISGELGADIEHNPLLGPQVYQAALDGLNRVAGTPKFIPAQEGAFFASQGAALMPICHCPKC